MRLAAAIGLLLALALLAVLWRHIRRASSTGPPVKRRADYAETIPDDIDWLAEFDDPIVVDSSRYIARAEAREIPAFDLPATTWELWDGDSRNLLGEFDSEERALAMVRELAEWAPSHDALLSLSLGARRADGSVEIVFGTVLLARAERARP